MGECLTVRISRRRFFYLYVAGNAGAKMFEFDAALSTAVAVDEKSRPAEKPAAGPKPTGPLSAGLLDKMQRYWCAANYLVVGQIICRRIRCCASRSLKKISSRACSDTGAHLRGKISSTCI